MIDFSNPIYGLIPLIIVCLGIGCIMIMEIIRFIMKKRYEKND